VGRKREMGPGEDSDPSDTLFVGPDKPPLTFRSRRMRELVALIKVIAARLAVTLVEGETGTGKELIARALHALSPRRDGPFVGLNCGELVEPLLESQLFGHVKGAFTSSHADAQGLIEAAHRGTLFLDEAHEMSPAMQRKILRFLEERQVRPVGASAARKVDIAVIAASNEDLLDLVDRGLFRKDLYFRLKVAFVRVPPLRERLEDLELLLDTFLHEYAQENHLPVPRIGEELLHLLRGHPWTGNVRELRNSIGTFFTSVREGKVDPDLLLAYLNPSPLQGSSNRDESLSPLEEVERRKTEETLRKCDWKKVLVAELLGIARTTLDRRIKKWRIKKA
jgi:transcriptional regulator with PAS, ATPase and Fis domain